MARRIAYHLTGGRDVYEQMALDEATLLHAQPMLRLYWMEPSAVTIGYFQELGESVDLEEALKLSIDVTRRPTGGGSVFHDSLGELVYSIVVPRSWLAGLSVEESYRVLAEGVVRAAKLLGVDARFEGLNDVVARGGKFSGQAQARSDSAVLQHGTVMYATRLEVLRRVLRSPKVKRVARGEPAARVTTLSAELGRSITRSEVIEALRRGFEEALGELLGAELVEEEPHPAVLRAARSLYWKYINPLWVTKR